MAWNVDLSPTAEKWLASLPRGDREKMAKQIDKLRAGGPILGRPAVDSVVGSQHSNMKELRVARSSVRALFAFGPDRRALILTGGSKASGEKRWYRQNVRVADRLFTEHLSTFRRGSACRAIAVGTRSAER